MPDLPDWYARLGFTITAATAEDRAEFPYEDAVVFLNMELSA